MCDPCQCLRRCFSCHGGGRIGCPRPCCHWRSRSMDSRNCRVVFPGEYQKFSDMIPPSFLQKDPKSRRKKGKSKCTCRSQKSQGDKESKEQSDSGGNGNKGKSGRNGLNVGPEGPGEPGCQGDTGVPGIPGYPGGPGIPGMPGMPGIPGIPGCPGVPIIPEGPGCPEGPETPGAPGPGIWFQPSDLPYYGSYGPGGNQMIFGIPPPCPYGYFGVPGPIGSPVAPRDPQIYNKGPPPAGLPTKRVPQFDPCTGQIFQCENQQMTVGSLKRAAQAPSYNQFMQGLNMGYRSANEFYLYNGGDGAVGLSPENLDRALQQNACDDQRNGNGTGEGGLAKVTDARNGPVVSQHQQYNPYNFVEETMDPRQDPQQNPSADCKCQGGNKSKSQRKRNESREDPRSNQHNRSNPSNFRGDPMNPRQDPQQNPSADCECQGGNKSRSQRKRNESREDARSNQHNRYNPANFRGDPINPRQDPHQNPTAGHVPQGGHRSKSQMNRNESREDHRFNPYKSREEPMMDPRQVPHQNPAAGHMSQDGNRSKTHRNRSESRADPRQNQHNRYNPNPPNFREEPMNHRQVSQANPPGNQVSQGASSSKSPEKRNESRRSDGARRPQSSRPPTLNKQCQCPSNFGDGSKNPRQVPPGSADQGQYGDVRSKSSRKRNESRGGPSEQQPEPNLHFYQQSVGMSYGPSNQCYVADCPLPDPIYVTQAESTWSESHPGDGRSSSPKRRQESRGGTSARRPESSSMKGKLRKEPQSKERNQPTEEAPLNQPIHCYSVRFEPNSQYYPYYVSTDYDCCPPPAENSRPLRGKSQDLASNYCPELLSRESCSSDDLQPWSQRLMPMEKSKRKSASAAKNSRRANGGTKSKSSSGKSSPKKSSPKKPSHKSTSKMSKQIDIEMDNESRPIQPEPVVEIPREEQEKTENSLPQEKAESEAPPASKPEMVSCSCSANLPEKPEEPVADNNAGCTNSCWIPCPSPWPGCYSPCNGYYYYCANCCNGCRNCCNYCRNPCGRVCCSRQPPPPTIPPKPKEKPTGGGVGKNGMKRYPGGTAVGSPECFSLRPPPELSCPISRPLTLPGYLPTARPQFNSPYSGQWQAGGVVSNLRSMDQNPMNISCMRH